ncbi:Hypothetical_protein [Hexamita inflata]|uniref:Hypothetical_protein n=1 Tax=Hexamita inflata TaxID=28002 RepID=A0ABP1HKM1_9EUKA
MSKLIQSSQLSSINQIRRDFESIHSTQKPSPIKELCKLCNIGSQQTYSPVQVLKLINFTQELQLKQQEQQVQYMIEAEKLKLDKQIEFYEKQLENLEIQKVPAIKFSQSAQQKNNISQPDVLFLYQILNKYVTIIQDLKTKLSHQYNNPILLQQSAYHNFEVFARARLPTQSKATQLPAKLIELLSDQTQLHKFSQNKAQTSSIQQQTLLRVIPPPNFYPNFDQLKIQLSQQTQIIEQINKDLETQTIKMQKQRETANNLKAHLYSIIQELICNEFNFLRLFEKIKGGRGSASPMLMSQSADVDQLGMFLGDQ